MNMNNIDNTETKIVVDDGKYTLIHSNGSGLRALRHGEPWREKDLIGDGMVLALVQEIVSLQDQKKQLENERALFAEAIEKMAVAANICNPNSELTGPQLLMLSQSILEEIKGKDLALEVRIGNSKIASNISKEVQSYSDDQEWDVEICRQSFGFNTIKVKAPSQDLAIEAADKESGNLLYSEKTVEYSFTANPKNVIVAKPSASKFKI